MGKNWGTNYRLGSIFKFRYVILFLTSLSLILLLQNCSPFGLQSKDPLQAEEELQQSVEGEHDSPTDSIQDLELADPGQGLWKPEANIFVVDPGTSPRTSVYWPGTFFTGVEDVSSTYRITYRDKDVFTATGQAGSFDMKPGKIISIRYRTGNTEIYNDAMTAPGVYGTIRFSDKHGGNFPYLATVSASLVPGDFTDSDCTIQSQQPLIAVSSVPLKAVPSNSFGICIIPKDTNYYLNIRIDDPDAIQKVVLGSDGYYTWTPVVDGACGSTEIVCPTMKVSLADAVTKVFKKPQVAEGVPNVVSSCTPPLGFTCQMSPLTMSPVPISGGSLRTFEVNSAWTYHFTAGPNVVHVHPAKFLSSFYTGDSATLASNQLTYNTSPRDVVISETPGSMTPVGGNFYCRKLGNGLGAYIHISFTGEPGLCNLKKDQQYYIQMKAHDTNTPIDYLIHM